jgi:hypothetical protein
MPKLFSKLKRIFDASPFPQYQKDPINKNHTPYDKEKSDDEMCYQPRSKDHDVGKNKRDTL